MFGFGSRWSTSALKMTPRAVMRHLQQPGDTYSVLITTWPGGGTWNPGRRPGIDNLIYEPGRGTYELRSDGQVELTWSPRYGSEQHYVGGVPQLKPQSKTVRLVVCGYLIVLAVAALLGALLSSGSGPQRVGYAVGSLFAAVIALWLLGVLISAIRAVRLRRLPPHG